MISHWVLLEVFLFSEFLTASTEFVDSNNDVQSEVFGDFLDKEKFGKLNSKISDMTFSSIGYSSIQDSLHSKSGKQLELQDDNKTFSEEILSMRSLDKSVYVQPPLIVELGEASSLFLSPNLRQEIYFEVTNNLNSPQRMGFSVRDEMRILLEIDRYTATLGAHESLTVRVSVLPRVGLGSDRITFLAAGSEQVRKEIIVDVDNSRRTDNDAPDVDYTYSSDCTDVLLSKCEHGSWAIKVSAKDSNSGLMLLTSIPKGMYFPDGYVGGTKEEVTGYYTDSCCKPDLQIIAVDRMNNRIVKQANAYKAPLSFWAIIAIIVVSLVIIILIAGCIVFCVKKFKSKEGDTFDLPTYRGGASRF